jgi:hypothetical protein
MTATALPTARPAAAPVGAAAALGTALDALQVAAPHLAGRVAVELWRRPGRVATVHPDEQGVMDAARLATVGPEGRRVVTYAWGDGARPVLLVHGWAARASRFAAVVEALLADGWSPVAYDAWGHGGSRGPVRTILEHTRLIEALGERHGPFQGVVAHSFGVAVALHAARHGLAAPRIVAISGIGDFGSLVDTFCDRLGAGERVNRALRRAIERRWFDGDTDIWDRFSAHPAPGREVLVVHDAGDRVVRRSQADLVTAAYGSRATLLETHGLGHGRILRDPAVVTAATGFLAGRTS